MPDQLTFEEVEPIAAIECLQPYKGAMLSKICRQV